MIVVVLTYLKDPTMNIYQVITSYVTYVAFTLLQVNVSYMVYWGRQGQG